MTGTETSEASDPKRRRVVVIIGLPGVGKSTVGRRTAQSLGWDFLDLDSAIEQRAGKSVRDIFDTEGEVAFRRRETEILRHSVESERPCIVAAGGGVVVTEENRDILKHARAVIWLTAPISDLETRLAPRSVRGRGHRPLLDGDLAGNLQRLESERSRLYEEVATDVVSTADATLEDVVRRLSNLIESEAHA